MGETYFMKFPTVAYSNVEVRDITRRVKLSDDLAKRPQLFYPYELSHSLRPDQLADAYYKDATYDWLIHLTNGIIDPYYGWPLNDYDFDNLILEKYGTVANAQSYISHWRINWSDGAEVRISRSYYENHLPFALKKYYKPELNARGQIYEYSRKKEEWIQNTNKIVTFEIDSDAFEMDERVEFWYSGEAVGSARVITSNSTMVFVKDVVGDTTANSTHILNIAGDTSGVNTATQVSETLENVIAVDEFVYWQSVSKYDDEFEKNEQRKLVHLIDANFALDASEELRLKLKET
jgi:hypothetical protein